MALNADPIFLCLSSTAMDSWFVASSSSVVSARAEKFVVIYQVSYDPSGIDHYSQNGMEAMNNTLSLFNDSICSRYTPFVTLFESLMLHKLKG